MSGAADLFDQVLVVHHMDIGADDPYGNGEIVEVGSDAYLGWLTQTGSTELTVGRDTALSDWEASLPPDAAIDYNDEVTDDLGRRFEVIGAPALARVPWGGVSHIVVRLQFLSGT